MSLIIDLTDAETARRYEEDHELREAERAESRKRKREARENEERTQQMLMATTIENAVNADLTASPSDEDLSDDVGELTDTLKCCICFEKKRCVVLLPCRHLASCYSCAFALRDQTTKKCPLCKNAFTKYMRVFF
jgi:Zinc finger, C3HC4 type (RING finger)